MNVIDRAADRLGERNPPESAAPDSFVGLTRARYFGILLLTALVVMLEGRFLTASDGVSCAFRPSMGLCLFFQYRYGMRAWFALFPAIVAGMSLTGVPFILALLNPLTRVTGCTITLAMFDRFSGVKGFTRTKAIYASFLLAPVLGTLTGSALAMGLFCAFGKAAAFFPAGARLAAGDAIGTIVLFALSISFGRANWTWPRILLVAAAASASVAGMIWLSHFVAGHERLAALPAIVPVVIGTLASFSFGTSGGAAVVAVSLAFIGGAAAANAGFFDPSASGLDPIAVSIYGALLVLAALPLGAAIDILKNERTLREGLLNSGRIAMWSFNTANRLSFIGVPPEPVIIQALRERLPMQGKADEFIAGDGIVCSLERLPSSNGEQVGILRDITVERRHESERLHSARREARLRSLRSFLEPHAMFNALAGLRGIIRSEPAAAITYVESLSRFLRRSLDAGGEVHHTLRDEFALVADFVEFRQYGSDVRFGPLPDLTLELAKITTPPGSLQVLLENAVKHGSPDDSGDLRIEVLVTALKDRCIVTVRNTGRLFKEDGAPGGLRFAREQLDATYQGNPIAKIQIKQDGPHVAAELSLPLPQ